MKDFKDWNIDDFLNVIDMHVFPPKKRVRIIHYRIKKGARKMPVTKLEYCKLDDVL